MIFEALCDNPQNRIDHWDLSNEGINMTIIESLSVYMLVSNTLTSVSISGNSLRDQGITAICKAIQGSKDIKLASLDISENGLRAAAVKSVADMIAASDSLTSVSPWSLPLNFYDFRVLLL